MNQRLKGSHWMNLLEVKIMLIYCKVYNDYNALVSVVHIQTCVLLNFLCIYFRKTFMTILAKPCCGFLQMKHNPWLKLHIKSKNIRYGTCPNIFIAYELLLEDVRTCNKLKHRDPCANMFWQSRLH